MSASFDTAAARRRAELGRALPASEHEAQLVIHLIAALDRLDVLEARNRELEGDDLDSFMRSEIERDPDMAARFQLADFRARAEAAEASLAQALTEHERAKERIGFMASNKSAVRSDYIEGYEQGLADAYAVGFLDGGEQSLTGARAVLEGDQ